MKCEEVEKYKNNLESEITKFMQQPVNKVSASAVDSMVECWKHINDMQNMIKKDFEFTPEKAEHWLLNMKNDDVFHS